MVPAVDIIGTVRDDLGPSFTHAGRKHVVKLCACSTVPVQDLISLIDLYSLSS